MSSVATSPTSVNRSSPAFSPTSVFNTPTSVGYVQPAPISPSPSLKVDTSPNAHLVASPRPSAGQTQTQSLNQTLSQNANQPFLQVTLPNGQTVYAEYGRQVTQSQFNNDAYNASLAATLSQNASKPFIQISTPNNGTVYAEYGKQVSATQFATDTQNSALQETLQQNSGPFVQIQTPNGIVYAENGKVVSQAQFNRDLNAANQASQNRFLAGERLIREEGLAESSVQNTVVSRPIGIAGTGRRGGVGRQRPGGESLSTQYDDLTAIAAKLASEQSTLGPSSSATEIYQYNQLVREYNTDLNTYNAQATAANAKTQSQLNAIQTLNNQTLSAATLSSYLSGAGIASPTLAVNGKQQTLAQYAKANPNTQFQVSASGNSFTITSVTQGKTSGSGGNIITTGLTDFETFLFGKQVSSNPIVQKATSTLGTLYSDELTGLELGAGYGGFFLSLPVREGYSYVTTGKAQAIPLPSRQQVINAGQFGLIAGGATAAGFLTGGLADLVIPEGAGLATTLGIRGGLQAVTGFGYGGLSGILTGQNPLKTAAEGAILFPLTSVGPELGVLAVRGGGKLLDSLLYPDEGIPSGAKVTDDVSSAASGAVSTVRGGLATGRLSLSQYFYQNILGRAAPESGDLTPELGTDFANIGSSKVVSDLGGDLQQGESINEENFLPGRLPTSNIETLVAGTTAPEKSVEIFGGPAEQEPPSILGVGAKASDFNVALAQNEPIFTSPSDYLSVSQYGTAVRVPVADFFAGIEGGAEEQAGTLADILQQGSRGAVESQQGVFEPIDFNVRGPSIEGVEAPEELTGAVPPTEVAPSALTQNDIGFLASRTTGAGGSSFEDIPDLLSGRTIESLTQDIAGTSREGYGYALPSGVTPEELGGTQSLGEASTQNAIDRILSEDSESVTSSGRTSPYSTNTIGRSLIDYREPDFEAQTYLNPKEGEGNFMEDLEFEEPTQGQTYTESLATSLPRGVEETDTEPYYTSPYVSGLRYGRYTTEYTFLRTPPGSEFGSILNVGLGFLPSTATASSSELGLTTRTGAGTLSSIVGIGQLDTFESELGLQSLTAQQQDTLQALQTQQVQSQRTQLDLFSIFSTQTVQSQAQAQIQGQAQIQEEDTLLDSLLTFGGAFSPAEGTDSFDFDFPFTLPDSDVEVKRRKLLKQRFKPSKVQNRLGLNPAIAFGDVGEALLESDTFAFTGEFL